jgi:hypothetical protein
VGNRKYLNLLGFMSNIAPTALISIAATIVKRQK